MTHIDRHVLKLIASDIETALQDVSKKYHVDIKYKGGSFTPTNATLKLEINPISDTGETVTSEASDFKLYAPMFGLNPDDLGKSFVSNFQTYTIIGLKKKSHTYPVLCKRSDGKLFKYPATTVKMLLK